MDHLEAYCDKPVSIGKNDTLIMRLFSQGLNEYGLELFTYQE